jgi:hypothetical protein
LGRDALVIALVIIHCCCCCKILGLSHLAMLRVMVATGICFMLGTLAQLIGSASSRAALPPTQLPLPLLMNGYHAYVCF